MPLKILFAASATSWDDYAPHLRAALAEAGLEAEIGPNVGPPAEVDYIVYAPSADLRDFTPFTKAKAVLNLWAGVEDVVDNETLTVPFARMVDSGMTEGMVEFVTGHVLRHHLNIDHALAHQSGTWVRHIPPLARNRPVTVLGLGALGQACAKSLAALNFPVSGWSRTPRDVPGIHCHSGPDGLIRALTGAQIVALLLPDTPATENTLNAETLALLEPGAFIVNPGRGPLIDDEALLAALDSGQVAHATLDVFREEPLPANHPFWSDPKVTVTPHVASQTRGETASHTIVENIRRGEAGEPFLHLVDRARGY